MLKIQVEVVLLNNLINLLHMLCNKINVQESVVMGSSNKTVFPVRIPPN